MMKGRKRERSKEKPIEQIELETPVKRRKRSYSGIDLKDSSEEKDDFQKYEISNCIADKLKTKQIESLFEVQKKVYKPIYEGKSVLASSLTGSGKTLAFVLPLLQTYHNKKKFVHDKPYIMVMAPTRELSIQVGREFSDLASKDFNFRTVMIYGGASIEDQISKLRNGCDIIVGTPGRIMDVIERKHLNVEKISTVVLDEADKMLSMGFEEQIEDIFKKIKEQRKTNIQLCLFSATIDHWVKTVAKKYTDQEIIHIDLVKDLSNKTPKTVTHLGVNCLKNEKTTTIADLILCYGGRNKATLIFVNTKRECNELMISDKIKQEVQIIHGDINQAQREATLAAFRSGKIKCLVATDVASRGLDIPTVDLVIQSEAPKEVDSYIHRAGRTARAGRSGTCITLYTRYTECLLERIEQKAKIKIKRIGAPQKQEIVNASIRDTAQCLIGIDDSMIKLFQTDAQKLIDEFGAENAVARLLAFVSGHTDKMKSRSLLCGAEGWITYTLKFTSKFQHAGYVWGFFKRLLNDEVKNKIRGMRCFSSLEGCVFDYPEEGHEILEEILFNDRYYGSNFTLEACDDLPELQDLNDQKHPARASSVPVYNALNKPFRPRDNRPGKIDIFVGNLPYDVNDDTFKVWLSKNGLDKKDFEIRIAIDKDNGQPRGFGFVSVYDKSIKDTLLNLNGKEFNRRKLIINESKGKK